MRFCVTRYNKFLIACFQVLSVNTTMPAGRGISRNFTNCAAEFGKICHGRMGGPPDHCRCIKNIALEHLIFLYK